MHFEKNERALALHGPERLNYSLNISAQWPFLVSPPPLYSTVFFYASTLFFSIHLYHESFQHQNSFKCNNALIPWLVVSRRLLLSTLLYLVRLLTGVIIEVIVECRVS